MFMQFSASDIVIIVLSLFISLAIHEAMHAYTAHALGDNTAFEEGRLSLNPLKHVDVVTTILLPLILIVSGHAPFFAAKPVPFDPRSVRHGEYGIALVGLAGPFTNLALAVLASIILHIGQVAVGTQIYTILVLFMQVNIGFFVFNMIPFPPLDGSRLLYAFAPDALRRLMEQIEAAGFMVIVVFILVLFPLISPIYTSISGNILNFLLQ
ncbi:MAG: site-2 protease family protein [Candidatus Saccharibacteria bacterium]